MRIWTIHLGEQLPIDSKPRLFRNGMLAETAAAMGHEVVTWAPTFSHLEKCHRREGDALVNAAPNWDLMLFECGSYARNVSLGRLRFHRRAARAFTRLAPTLPRPDVIFCSLPTPGMAAAAVRFAASVPPTKVVIDTRDLWPDVYATLAPEALRGLARVALRPMAAQNRMPLQQADAVTAVSGTYLSWAQRNGAGREGQAQQVFILGYRPQPVGNDPQTPPAVSVALDRAAKANLSICYVGQFGHFYDLETVVAAVRRLEDAGHDGLSLTLCGSGVQDDRLRALARGSKAIQFTGWIDAEQIGRVLRANDLGVLSYTTSAAQSLPNKPFEYMAYGVGLISSLGGEMEDILARERCGFGFAPGDVGGLANLIERLLQDRKSVDEARANASRFFAQYCSADRIYADLTHFLEGIVTGRPIAPKEERETLRR